MKLAAVTVHYGNTSQTASLVEALVSCDCIHSISVVLHDEYQAAKTGRASWITAENRGYAAGLNLAVRTLLLTQPDCDAILAMNPDVTIRCSQIQELLANHSPESGAAFPALRESRRLVHGYRFSRFGSLRITRNPEWYSGACFVFSIDAWKRIGGFDESYFHYFEDWAFCRKLRETGYRLNSVSNVVIDHAGKSGANYALTPLPKYAVRNHLMALQKSGLLNPVSFINVAVRHFLYLFRWKQGWRGIGAWIQGINEFRRANTSTKVVE